jgi:hypothetical protein
MTGAGHLAGYRPIPSQKRVQKLDDYVKKYLTFPAIGTFVVGDTKLKDATPRSA